MIADCSGVILAGGPATRYKGEAKSLLEIGGRRIVDRLLEMFKELFDDLILVTNDPHRYYFWDCTVVTDLLPVRSSLTGIHTALFYAKHPHVFVTAGDIPFLQKGVVETVLAGIEPGVDLVIPETEKGLEPLCAVYSKGCLNLVEQRIHENKLKISRVFKNRRIKKIPEGKLREKDPQLFSFYNINTPEDYVAAQDIFGTLHTKEMGK